MVSGTLSWPTTELFGLRKLHDQVFAPEEVKVPEDRVTVPEDRLTELRRRVDVALAEAMRLRTEQEARTLQAKCAAELVRISEALAQLCEELTTRLERIEAKVASSAGEQEKFEENKAPMMLQDRVQCLEKRYRELEAFCDEGLQLHNEQLRTLGQKMRAYDQGLRAYCEDLSRRCEGSSPSRKASTEERGSIDSSTVAEEPENGPGRPAPSSEEGGSSSAGGGAPPATPAGEADEDIAAAEPGLAPAEEAVAEDAAVEFLPREEEIGVARSRVELPVAEKASWAEDSCLPDASPNSRYLLGSRSGSASPAKPWSGCASPEKPLGFFAAVPSLPRAEAATAMILGLPPAAVIHALADARSIGTPPLTPQAGFLHVPLAWPPVHKCHSAAVFLPTGHIGRIRGISGKARSLSPSARVQEQQQARSLSPSARDREKQTYDSSPSAVALTPPKPPARRQTLPTQTASSGLRRPRQSSSSPDRPGQRPAPAGRRGVASTTPLLGSEVVLPIVIHEAQTHSPPSSARTLTPREEDWEAFRNAGGPGRGGAVPSRTGAGFLPRSSNRRMPSAVTGLALVQQEACPEAPQLVARPRVRHTA